MGSQDPGNDPTPEEIEWLKWLMQREWTEREERRHRTGLGEKVPYTVPRYADEVILEE